MSTPNNIVVGNQSIPQGQFGSMVPISYIVANIQNELNDYGPELKRRAMQIVIDGVREMRLYHQASIQVGYFTIPDSGVLNFPVDYLTYTKVGIPVNGQLVTLSVNENMLLNRAEKCGEDIRRMTANTSIALAPYGGYYYAPHYNNGNFIGALYGAGGGFNVAYFREDLAARQFQFDGVIPSISEGRIVVIEYESTGISEGTILGAECIDVLKNWYFWRSSRHRKDLPASRILQYKEDYESSVMRLRAFTQSRNLTIQDYMDILYRNYKQTPKL